MAETESQSSEELNAACAGDCLAPENNPIAQTSNGPSAGKEYRGEENKGLMLKSNKNSFDDLFASDSDSDSLFGDIDFKNLFGGNSLFSDSDKESDKSTFEARVAEDFSSDNECDWPAPPDFTRSPNVLDTVRNLAIENFDVILQRTVRERSSELRELQNSARPVTGTNARNNLSEFFTQATNQDAVPSQQQRGSLPDDVQNLIQRSIVTSALRRQGFRSALEEALSSRMMPPSTVRANFFPRNSSARSLSGMSTPSIPQQDFDALSVASEATTEQNDASDAASDIEQLQRVLDASVQVLSETIEEDLAHLHHLHVVSSVLDGGFRDNLERLFQERARTVGGGEVVQQFIRSLPSAQRPPRPSNPTNTRPAQPPQAFSRTQNMQLSAEISSLKQQMAEMKQMLQMTFEMQMDTQRAIRQEVSGVFGAFMQQMSQASNNGMPSHQTTAPSRNPVPVTAGSCVICFDRQVDAVFYQCGHMCACHTCGLQLKMQGHKCPMCRAPIRDVIRAYKTQ